MSYLVLARKLRPNRFDDLIGQEKIAQTLKNAIQSHRVAHAFLLTGTRGVGKTSCARILTKALNCLEPIHFEPCNQCENCQEITTNSATDVIEIDAASNRGIEHIRELRENINFTTSKTRYKVYIIDEVHMLTLEAFNALLKTLEEPPEHVKFILATTDPHKVPATIMSRCQRFDFLPISVQKMHHYLQDIITKESIEIDNQILIAIAKNAQGSMRDALTSLDMIISLGGKNIDSDVALSILGINQTDQIFQLYEYIVEQNMTQAFELSNRLLTKGVTIPQIIGQFFKIIQNVSLAKCISFDDTFWKNLDSEEIDKLKALRERLSHSILQQQFQLVLDLEQQIKKSNYAIACFQMGMINLTKIENLVSVKQMVQHLQSLNQDDLQKIDQTVKPQTEQTTSIQNQKPTLSQTEQQVATSYINDNNDVKLNIEKKLSEAAFHEQNQKYQLEEKSIQNKTELTKESENINKVEPIKTQLNNKEFVTEPIKQTQPVAEKHIEVELAEETKKIPNFENWSWFINKIKNDCPNLLISILNNVQLIEFNAERLVMTSESGGVSKLINQEQLTLIKTLVKKYYDVEVKVMIDENSAAPRKSNYELDRIEQEKIRSMEEEKIINTPLIKEVMQIKGMELKQINIKEN